MKNKLIAIILNIVAISSLISCATVSTVDFDVDIIEIRDLANDKYVSLDEKPLREIRPYEQIEVIFQTKLNLLNLAIEKYNILCEYNNSKKDIGFIFLEGNKQDKNLPLEMLVDYSFASKANRSDTLSTYACNLPKSSISKSSGFSFNVDARKYFPYDIYRSRTVKLAKETIDKLYKPSSASFGNISANLSEIFQDIQKNIDTSTNLSGQP